MSCNVFEKDGNRGHFGNLRATFPVLEMFSTKLEVFCFRGRKLPQGLYNRSNKSTSHRGLAPRNVVNLAEYLDGGNGALVIAFSSRPFGASKWP